MSRIGRAVVAGAAVAMMAAPLAAQGGQGQGPVRGRGMMAGGPGVMARNPVAVVLDHRDDLELTDEQVQTLETLRDHVQQENEPRWQQLQDAFGDADPRSMSVEERQAFRERMQALQPVREEIRASNRAAMDEVHELLTTEQETELRQIMRRRSGGVPGRGMRSQGVRRPGWGGV
jgi:hypothetical protein